MDILLHQTSLKELLIPSRLWRCHTVPTNPSLRLGTYCHALRYQHPQVVKRRRKTRWKEKWLIQWLIQVIIMKMLVNWCMLCDILQSILGLFPQRPDTWRLVSSWLPRLAYHLIFKLLSFTSFRNSCKTLGWSRTLTNFKRPFACKIVPCKKGSIGPSPSLKSST